MGFNFKGLFAPRRRLAACIIFIFVVTAIVMCQLIIKRHKAPKEDNNNKPAVAKVNTELEITNNNYNIKYEDLQEIQTTITPFQTNKKDTYDSLWDVNEFSPEVHALLDDLYGTKAGAGIYTKQIQHLRSPYIFQLLPHLLKDKSSLKPSYHLISDKKFVNLVIGVPTVRRDSENYLLLTIMYLIEGLTTREKQTTLIVVMIGETDLEFILETARQIQTSFSKHVDEGLIEIISPGPAYYPDLENLPTTLGDSKKRMKWRTKQNLDAIYLMAYASSKSTYYLMLEDDVVAKSNYAQAIISFTEITDLSHPGWVFIDFCNVGGIGKLFRSLDLFGFIIYVQLFYKNMPFDWLLENYLADKVCGNERYSNNCITAKDRLRPRYKDTLFEHIGLFSSLKGKIQKVKNPNIVPVRNHFPHSNPPVSSLFTTIKEVNGHTLEKAYNGKTYFWGEKPVKNDIVEFWFKRPILIKRYCFRSGNPEHILDKFRNTIVEVLPARHGHNFTKVNAFDEFGVAEGELHMGPVKAMRLRLLKDGRYWVVLSEIDLTLEKQVQSR